jgi:hypothetical protein
MFEYKGPAQIEQGQIIQHGEFEIEDGEYYVEIKVFKSKPREKKTLTAKVGTTEFDKYVSRFWSAYPKRDGKHLNKKLGQQELNKISSDEIEAVILGASNFAKSQQARDGFAPDAFRWLQRRNWEEWQEQPTRERNRVTL